MRCIEDFSARCREEHDEEVFKFPSIFMRLMELWKSVIIPMNDLLNSSLKIIQQIIAYYIKFLHCISEINLIFFLIVPSETLGNVSTNGSKSYVLRLANLSSNLTKEKWIVHNNGSYFSLVMRVTFFRFIHDQLFPSVTKN
ncbi:unnamed protein product [Rhizophagus irregularis]|nr:unnamed protein product [Rhizophagus irregularis]